LHKLGAPDLLAFIRCDVGYGHLRASRFQRYNVANLKLGLLHEINLSAIILPIAVTDSLAIAQNQKQRPGVAARPSS
jgi:hypothetical protein